jgi:hypothetical protein
VLNASGIKYNIKSDGIDLLKVPLTSNEVAFMNSSFSRAMLYSKIKDIHN